MSRPLVSFSLTRTDVFVARVMTALARSSKLGTSTLSRSVAGFILRYLSTHGWIHKGADGLTFGKNVSYEGVLKRIESIEGDGVTPVDWIKQGNALNEELKVKDGFLRSYGGVSIGALFALASFAYAFGNEGKDPHIRALEMAAGLASTKQAITKAAEIAALRRLDDVTAKALKDSAGRLGALASAFGIAASLFAMAEERNRGNTYGMWTNALGAAASAMSIGAWWLSAKLAWSLAFTGMGIALSAIALALILLEDELRDGPSYLVDQYWKEVTRPQSPARRFPSEVDDVEVAVRRALAHGAFDDFHMRVGGPGNDLLPDDPPTFHAAHALGFEQREIATLFNVRPAVVRTQANIPAVDYGELVR